MPRASNRATKPANGDPQPTPASERIDALDAMRGIAIMGVLLAETVWSLGNPPRGEWNAFDHAVARGMDLFVDTKFLSLFACLFGAGIAMQWRRWEASGNDLVRLHLRRMGFLLGVGLLHGLLLRNGDILAPYAILGLLLLPLRHVPTGALIGLALVLLWVPYVTNTLVGAAGLKWPDRPESVAGGYLAENWAWLRYWYLTNPLRSWPTIMALMLAGMLLFRSGVVERLAANRSAATWSLAISVSIAAATRVTFDLLSGAWEGRNLGDPEVLTLGWLYHLSSWSLAAAYASLLLYLCQRPSASSRLSVVKTVGRMAFTNYLTQALIVVPICLAFGLFDQVSPGRGLYFGLAVGAAQIVFSVWWMRSHAMGPFERLWRRATYGRRAAKSP